MKLIDAHTHCGNNKQTKFYDIDDVIKNLAETEAETYGAVIFAFPEDMYRTVDSVASRNKANEYVLEASQQHENIYPFYFVWNDYIIPDNLESYAGIKWHRHADEPRYDYDDPKCEAILKRIRDLKLPVTIEEEYEYTVRFIERNEGHPVIIPHIGSLNGGYKRMVTFYDNPNVYFDTSVAPLEAIKTVLKNVGPERIIFGTDVSGTGQPFFNFPKVELAKISQLDLDEKSLTLILFSNIERLIGKGQRG